MTATRFFDESLFQAFRAKGLLPEDIPDMEERQAYSMYLEKLQALAAQSTQV